VHMSIDSRAVVCGPRCQREEVNRFLTEMAIKGMQI